MSASSSISAGVLALLSSLSSCLLRLFSPSSEVASGRRQRERGGQRERPRSAGGAMAAGREGRFLWAECASMRCPTYFVVNLVVVLEVAFLSRKDVHVHVWHGLARLRAVLYAERERVLALCLGVSPVPPWDSPNWREDRQNLRREVAIPAPRPPMHLSLSLSLSVCVCTSRRPSCRASLRCDLPFGSGNRTCALSSSSFPTTCGRVR